MPSPSSLSPRGRGQGEGGGKEIWKLLRSRSEAAQRRRHLAAVRKPPDRVGSRPEAAQRRHRSSFAVPSQPAKNANVPMAT